MLTWSDQEFHALQWWGLWYQYQCERWVNDGQLCPSHLSSINNLVSKLIFNVPKCFQISSSNVSTSFFQCCVRMREKCVASLDTSSYLVAAQVPTPPHLTADDRISTANQAALTSLGSYTFQAFPNKGNLPPATYARNPSFHRPWRLWPVHLFLSFLFLFQISCLCWKWVEFVSIYWMTAQKLAQCSPFSSKWWRFLSSKYHIRWSWYEDQPSKALSIHAFFQGRVWDCNSECMMTLCQDSDCNSAFTMTTCLHKLNAVDCVSDCHRVFIMTTCIHTCSRLGFRL